MARISDDMLGGAYVRARFTMGQNELTPMSPPLTREQVLSIPRASREALVNTGKLDLFPAAPAQMTSSNPNARRFAVHMGMGRFDVIEGVKLNAEPLSRAAAEAMVPEADRPKGRKPKAN